MLGLANNINFNYVVSSCVVTGYETVQCYFDCRLSTEAAVGAEQPPSTNQCLPGCMVPAHREVPPEQTSRATSWQRESAGTRKRPLSSCYYKKRAWTDTGKGGRNSTPRTNVWHPWLKQIPRKCFLTVKSIRPVHVLPRETVEHPTSPPPPTSLLILKRVESAVKITGQDVTQRRAKWSTSFGFFLRFLLANCCL